MKLQTIQVYHVRGCEYADIRPRDRGLTILGGANSAGKSSALDAIAMAIGGKRLFPRDPIQDGQDEAEIVIALDGGTVALPWPCKVHRVITRDEGGLSYTTEVKIIADDGETAPTPQKILDSLLTPRKLEFDPVRFIGEKPTVQADIVQKLVGLDFTEMDIERTRLFNARTALNRRVRDIEGDLREMPMYDDVPREKIDVSREVQEIRAAENHNISLRILNATMAEKNRELRDVMTRWDTLAPQLEVETQRIHDDFDRRIAALNAEKGRMLCKIVEEAERRGSDFQREIGTIKIQLAEIEKLPLFGKPEVDPEPIRVRIEKAAEINTKIEAVDARLAVMQQRNGLKKESLELTESIEALDRNKKKTMAEAKWPIEGLGFDEAGGLVWNGHVLPDLASSEQLKIAVAIAVSLNPVFRYAIIRDGSLLDEQRLQELEAIAEDLDAQVLVERVSEGAECHYVFKLGRSRKGQ